jgi:DNA repair protein SbcD/Mre11
MKIIHFADLHLGVENYGHVNPETGLSSRLEDFLSALDQLIDFALDNKVDLVLFCGDAYKTREPSQTQQREFAKRIKRLSEGGIPFFLLIGNHDLPNAIGRATTMEIFDTLSVPNVQVSNRPGIYRVRTKSGEVQIAALPWVRRSALLSKEDTRNLDFNQINQRLQDILTGIIADLAAKLDSETPAILAAHIWVMNAVLGSEKAMSIGQEHMLLLSSVAQPAFDYVALGHIHKGQVLKEEPPTIYSGSLERLDFGDEEIEKGFYLLDIESGSVPGKRRTSYQFIPVKARRFFTLKIEITPEDPDPTGTVIRAVESNQEKIRDAVVRLEIKLPSAVSSRLRDNEINSRLKDAYYFTIAKEIQRENRSRLGRSALEGVTPLDALKAYLETRHSPERAKLLLEYGEKLIQSANSQE